MSTHPGLKTRRTKSGLQSHKDDTLFPPEGKTPSASPIGAQGNGLGLRLSACGLKLWALLKAALKKAVGLGGWILQRLPAARAGSGEALLMLVCTTTGWRAETCA